MWRLAILADDLTGALDTAAPFAAKDDAVTVAWRIAAVAGRGAFAFGTGRADLRLPAARAGCRRGRYRRRTDGTRAESVAAIGEWSPGVPVARIAGGAWRGATLISKSGAYGDPGLLLRILDNATESAHA